MTDTLSLKALARAVLARDCQRDSAQDNGRGGCLASDVLPPVEARRSTQPNLVAPPSWFARAVPPAEGEPGIDVPWFARRGRVEKRGGVLLHFCAECGAWGAFGYGVDLPAGRFGRWYCREHRPRDGLR